MDPHEEGLRTAAAYPVHGGIDDVTAPTLRLQLRSGAELWKIRVEQVEALAESVLRPKNEGADETAGAVSSVINTTLGGSVCARSVHAASTAAMAIGAPRTLTVSPGATGDRAAP